MYRSFSDFREPCSDFRDQLLVCSDFRGSRREICPDSFEFPTSAIFKYNSSLCFCVPRLANRSFLTRFWISTGIIIIFSIALNEHFVKKKLRYLMKTALTYSFNNYLIVLNFFMITL